MRAPLSWLREYVDLPDVSARDVAGRLIRAGLEVESVEAVGADVRGVVVGEVLEVEELAGFKKPIRYVRVADGSGERSVICGATNFVVGDRVPVVLPGGALAGGLEVGERRTYGRASQGMICSARELGVGEDASGILVLDREHPLGADVVELLGLRDDVLDIAVTPDRGYCLSLRGIAREAAIAFDVEFRDPASRPVPHGRPAGWEVRVEDPVGCDVYVARAASGLGPAAPSPLQLQRRVQLAGMRPISLAVDVTNAVMLELGQPLHAFDRAKLSGPIVVRRARVGEKLTTLDGVARELDPDDLLITDESGPIALAGVMGGAATEIAGATADVLIEAAHFDPASVARTARRHRLPSEASRRFERGVDPEVAEVAAQRAVELLASLAGATDEPAATVVRAPRERVVVRMPVEHPSRIAGHDYAPAAVRRRLEQVGCELADEAVDGALEVVAPSWRPDLTGPADLVEEVVRLEGYDGVPSVLPAAPAGRGLTREQRRWRAVGRALASAGYVEVLTYPFVAPSVWDALGLEPDDERRRTVTLANPLSDQEPALRTTLLPGLLAALVRNVGRGLPDLSLFETGLVFRPRPGAGVHRGAVAPRLGVDRGAVAPRLGVDRRPSASEIEALEAVLPDQPQHVAVVLCGARERGGWWGPARPAAWSDAVEAARTVAHAVRAPMDARAGVRAPWHPGRCAELVVGPTVVGHAGELHPRVVAALGLPERTCAMELALAPVLGAAVEVVPAPPVSTYPAAVLDVALVVDGTVPAAQVEAALRSGAGELLEAVRLFDVYTGAQIGEGRKSLAYALRLRAADRTLTNEEANAARDAAVAEAARRTGAMLRGA